MTPLVAVDDIARRLGRPIDTSERPRVQAATEDVSALIRAYVGVDFEHHQDQDVTLAIGPQAGADLILPSSMRPIQSVTAARVNGQAVDDFWLEGHALYRRRGWASRGPRGSLVTITATWGYSAVPDDIRAVCAAEVMRLLALSPGVYSERVGDLEVTYSGGGAQGELSPQVRRTLSRYRVRLGSVGTRRV